MRATHGDEIAFVFDNGRPPVMNGSSGRSALAARMSDAWVAFARTGGPGWPPYTLDGQATMTFDRGECRMARDCFDAVDRQWAS